MAGSGPSGDLVFVNVFTPELQIVVAKWQPLVVIAISPTKLEDWTVLMLERGRLSFLFLCSALRNYAGWRCKLSHAVFQTAKSRALEIPETFVISRAHMVHQVLPKRVFSPFVLFLSSGVYGSGGQNDVKICTPVTPPMAPPFVNYLQWRVSLQTCARKPRSHTLLNLPPRYRY